MKIRRGPHPGLVAAGLLPPLALAAILSSALAPDGEAEAAPVAEQRTAALGYQAYEDWDIILPNETWTAVKDSIPIPHADGEGFAVEQVGPLKLRVDTNADGKLDGDIKGDGGFLRLRAKGVDGEPFEYAVRIAYQGGKYRFASSGAMSGKVNGVPVKLIDRDNNGHYADYGSDAVVVGGARGATLLSRVLNAEGELFEIEVSGDGRTLRYRPWSGATASLEVSAQHENRGRLESAVFQNEDGDVFNVVQAPGSMKLPAGTYRFVYGFVTKGDETVNIRTGKMPAIELRAGEQRALEWGGPLVAEFDYSVVGETITVHPNVAFYGTAGEEYYTFQPDAKSPKIIVTDKETKKIYTEGRFGGC